MDSAAVAAAVPYQLRQLEFPTRDKEGPKKWKNYSFQWLSQPQLSVPDLMVCSFHKVLQMVLSADESVLKVTKMAMGAEFKAGTVTQQFTQMIQASFSTHIFITGGSCHKYQKYACCDKYLSQQTSFCRDKSVVMTSVLLLRQNLSFVTTRVCWSQQNFCCDKITFAATKVLSWQAYFLSQQKTCFVATKMILVAAFAKYTVLVVFLCFLLDVSIGWGKMGGGGGGADCRIWWRA